MQFAGYGTLTPYFATLTALDTTTSLLGNTYSKIIEGWENFLNRCKSLRNHCKGWFRAVEIAPAKADSKLENLHLHGLFLMDKGYAGRNYLSQNGWNEIWQRSLPDLARSAEVSRARDLESVCSYTVKHGWEYAIEKAREAIADIPRFLEQHYQLANRRKLESGGCLRSVRLGDMAFAA